MSALGEEQTHESAHCGRGRRRTDARAHASRRGVESVIFEQASEIREVGVGINILPHAIKELAALDLMPKLDAVGIRTKELHYVSRLGQKVWSELRGTDAGFDYPQFSIHRGRLQKVIHDEVDRRDSVPARCAPA